MLRIAPTSYWPIGIDLAAGGVKLLQLHHECGGAAIVNSCRLTAGPDDAGCAAELRAAIAFAGFRGGRCVVGLARQDVLACTVTMPATSKEDVDEFSRLHAARAMNIPADVIDVRVARTGACPASGAGDIELLVFAVARNVLRKRQAMLAAAGLEPAAFEPAATALARMVGDSTARRVVLDVGASGSTIVVMRGDEIVGVRSIAIGAREIDRAVGRRFGVAHGDALGVAAVRRDGNHPAVGDAVHPIARHFARELRVTLQSFGASFRGPAPDKVVITGEGERIPRLADLIESTCGLPAVPEPDANWTLAAGLARRGGRAPAERVAA